MKIFKKILFIFFIVITILSASLAVCLSFSSTNKLIIKDDEEARTKLYNKIYYALYNHDNYTVTYQSTTETGEGEEKTTTKTIDHLVCSLNTQENFALTCSMISEMYKNSELTKKAYFPGDGYKYSVKGEETTKEVYLNATVNTYFSGLRSSLNSYFSNLLIKDINNESVKSTTTIDTSAKFDFKTFSLIKTVKITNTSETNPYECAFTFDGNDRLIGFNYDDGVNPVLEYKIGYEKEELNFPSFENPSTEGAN